VTPAVRRHAAALLALMAPEPPRLVAARRALILRGDYQGPGRNPRRRDRCPACHRTLDRET
jgi:hypothetical protein